MTQHEATPAGTRSYFERFPTIQTRPLGQTGLTISAAGFGCYRINSQNNTHRTALTEALTGGINLIDTSSNYGDGESEKLVGSVLNKLFKTGYQRENFVVVTKGGYLQGENYAISQQKRAGGNSFPDLVEYANGLEHCIHPEFLADQITRSLNRLQLKKIDLYLLHNPEYYLGWGKKFDLPLEEARREYRRRLILAFEHLEKEVANGRVVSYGVSSNGFPNPADRYDFTSVEQLWEIAAEISSAHHFAAIQLPMNLLETGGLTEPNQSKGRSTLEFAFQKDLGVLINRPLNAVIGNNLIRLADVAEQGQPADPELVNGLVDGLINQEERLKRAVMGSELPFRTKQEFAATMAAGRLLADRWAGFGTLSNWRDVQNGYLKPRSQFGVQFLRRRPEMPPEAAGWIDEYEQIFDETLRSITAVYRADERQTIEQIKENVAAADPDWGQTASTSRAALRALRTTEGISCVLVGMRRPPYVQEVLEELQEPVSVKKRAKGWELLKEAVTIE